MIKSERAFKVTDFLGYACFCLLALALPLFFDPRPTNFYIIPKQYVLVALTLGGLIFFLIQSLVTKRIFWRRSVFSWLFLAFFATAFLSALFSENRFASFLGENNVFTLSFVFLFFSGVLYWLAINYVSTARRWRVVLEILKISFAVAGLIFVLKTIFNLDLVGKYLGASGIVSELASSLGVVAVVLFMLSAGAIVKKELSWSKVIVNLFYSILSLTVLTLISFNALWWFLVIGLALLLLLGFGWLKEVRLWWLTALFALLATVMVFLIFGTPKILRADVPSELGLGLRASYEIGQKTILKSVKNFVFGSGLGTFGYDFSRFRPDSFNYEKLGWSLRFDVPYSSALALLCEGGVLLVLVMAFMFLFVLGHILSAWRKTRWSGFAELATDVFGGTKSEATLHFDAYLASGVWVLLSLGMFLFYYGPVQWYLWWMFLALSVVAIALCGGKFIRSGIWKVGEKPQYSLSFSFVLVILLMFAVLAGIWGLRIYGAEMNFARGAKESDLGKARERILKAIEWNGSSSAYHLALSQVYLRQALNESKNKNVNGQKVAGFLSGAVESAKKASELAPRAVSVWENLAVIYGSAAAVVPEGRDWAIKSLEEAVKLEPNNPLLYWYLGNNFGLANKWDDAKKNFEKAIALKNDYVQGYIGLSNVYEQAKDLDKAIETYAGILPWALGNPDVLFNYGRLLYNRNHSGDRALAQKAWLECERVSPNYSNTLYSLGLLYESKGDNVKALHYFNRVKELNPDNQDVALKVEKLLGQSKQ